jgi:hypothetical protein
MLAEFAHADALLAAARALAAEGVDIADAFTPFPLEELDEHIVRSPSLLPWITGISGLTGAIGGYVVQWWSAVIDYPIDSGGRPPNSWPAFIPVTFELGVLFAAFGAFLGMLALNGLPRLHHPLFDVERFSLATRTKFFLYLPFTSEAEERTLAERLRALGAAHTQSVIE